MMKVRKANFLDIEGILEIVKDAKNLFKSRSSSQWQDSNGYPNYETFQNDLKYNNVYVVVDNNAIVSVAVVSYLPDENYMQINGKWINDENYAVIHRVAVKKEYYHRGCAKMLFQNIEKDVLEHNYYNIRIDTAEDNEEMLGLINYFHYQYCGIIRLKNNTTSNPYRLAFHKILE